MYKLVKIAWRNLFRNKRRSLITAFVISISFIALLFFQYYITAMKTVWKEVLIRHQYGHLQIFHKNYNPLDPNGLDFLITQKEVEKIKDLLMNHEEVEWVTTHKNISGLIGTEKKSATYVGQGKSPLEKENMYFLPPTVKGNFIDEKNLDHIVIGDLLAQKLNVEIGDSVLLLTTSIANSYEAVSATISGFISVGTKIGNSFALVANQKLLNDLLLTESVHNLLVLLYDSEETINFTKKIRKEFEEKNLSYQIKSFFDLADIYNSVIKMYQSMFYVVLIILSIVIVFSILNTMYMSITERMREFSTMKTLGITRKNIFFVIILEGFFLTIIAVALGTVLGNLLSYLINLQEITLSPPPGGTSSLPLVLLPNLEDNLFTLFFFLGISFLASFLPALKVSHTKIIDGLYYN